MDKNPSKNPAQGGIPATGESTRNGHGGKSIPGTSSGSAGSSDLSELADLDRLVHEPARLAVMALLYVVESADFTFLMNQTGLTWGNLSTHMSKLEEGGYLEVEKSFRGRRPNTTLRLTPLGRKAFQDYARKMKQFFQGLPG